MYLCQSLNDVCWATQIYPSWIEDEVELDATLLADALG